MIKNSHLLRRVLTGDDNGPSNQWVNEVYSKTGFDRAVIEIYEFNTALLSDRVIKTPDMSEETRILWAIARLLAAIVTRDINPRMVSKILCEAQYFYKNSESHLPLNDFNEVQEMEQSGSAYRTAPVEPKRYY